METYITNVDILDEAKENFLTFAEEVLTDRAVPNAEDGLLSSQRKILWTMYEYLKLNSSSKTKKCQSIIGSTLSTAYMHGDASCYGVLCKMAQEYLMRYPLIKGQGGLGTQADNSMVSSSRYTEAKPSIYADALFNDYTKKVVPLKETYNGEFMEPVILPALFPNALVNGREAIGVSMAHNSLPNNLSEVCNGIVAYIQQEGNIDTKGLMEYIKGPDFPLGGTVINQKDIYNAYNTGRSTISLKVRGDYTIEGNTVIFTSIPYRTYRNKIKDDINKNIETLEKFIDDFDDESSIGENKLIFKIKKGVDVNKAIEVIFKLTDLQATLSYNMNFIVDGTPKLCSLKDLIAAYVKHQTNVLLKATEFDKNKAEARIHILDGLLAAIDKIDEIIKLIKDSSDKTDARNKLINFLSIDEVQANAILDMKLSRLTRIDKDELIQEKKKNEDIVAECIKIISNKEYRNEVLIKKIQKLKADFGDERRTKLINYDIPKEEKIKEEIIPEKCVVVMTEGGKIKRIPIDSFKIQKKNTKGIKAQDDITSCIIRTSTADSLMIFSTKGVMYRINVGDIPNGTNSSVGQSVKILTKMAIDEEPATIYSIYHDTDAKYVLFATKKGTVKKTALEEYVNTSKKTGVAAIKLREGDSLAAVTLIKDEDIFLITKNGHAIRFNSSEVASGSRNTIGLKGIALPEGDEIIACLPIRDKTDDLAIFNADGRGRRLKLDSFSAQARGGKGLKLAKDSGPRTAAAILVNDNDNVLIVGNKNSVCISAKDIPVSENHQTIGSILIKADYIKSATKV